MPKTDSRTPITQEDVAKHAGVSRSIVSYVLNNGPRKVSAETRHRVLAAIQELGYRPNKYAQRLKLGANAAQNSIGVIAGGKSYNLLERPYYSVILASLFDTAHQLNQHIRFFSFFDALKDPIFFNRNIHAEEISSLLLLLPELIATDPEHEPLVMTMIERIDNIICLETSIYGLPALIVDLVLAAQLAVEHLINLGHKRIGFICVDRENDGRAIGYKRTLMMHNIGFDVRLMRFVHSANLLKNAYDLTLELINAHPDMTAIFAANDEIAIAALAALHDNGLKAPDDMAIISIDNTKISSMVRPALTTVHIPISEIGEYALKMLISQREHALDLPMSMTLPIQLIVRESCGTSKVHLNTND